MGLLGGTLELTTLLGTQAPWHLPCPESSGLLFLSSVGQPITQDNQAKACPTQRRSQESGVGSRAWDLQGSFLPWA